MSRAPLLRARLEAGMRHPWGATAALVAGALGAATGALLAEAVVRALPLPTGGLAAARAAGVHSMTTWAGYPKSAELLFLAVGLGVSCAVGLAAAVAALSRLGRDGGRDAPAARDPSGGGPLPRVHGWEWLVLLALLAYGAQPTPLVTLGRLYLILAEEGAHLLALTTLLHGGRLSEDLDYIYGPLLLAPLLPAHFIEPSVAGVRVATLLLHGLGLAGVAALARPLFRTRAGWIAAALLLAWLVPLPAPRLHLTAYRSALAFAPFLFLPRALAGGRGGWLGVGAGVAAAVLTSPELLTPSLAGPLAALALAAQRRIRAVAELAAGLAGGLAIGLLLFLPVLDPLGWLQSTVEKLDAVRLGFLARVYPVPWGADRLWRGAPFGLEADVDRYLWQGNAVLAIAAAGCTIAAFGCLRRPRDANTALLLGFALCGALLLPKLVSRPGVYQFAKVLPGVLLVTAALAEAGALRWLRTRGAADLVPALLGAIGLATLAVSVPLRAGLPRAAPRPPVHDATLGAILLQPGLASFIARVREAVDRRLPPGAPVWSAPAAPGWNYVLDRPPANPLSIWFVTTGRASRERLRDQLAADPPPLVLRHTDRPTFEGVPRRAFLGVAADWLDERYAVVEVVRHGAYTMELLAPTPLPAAEPVPAAEPPPATDP
ncbi:MAG: hypothetical protein ACQGVC_11270 [Myxococcota bacterium]